MDPRRANRTVIDPKIRQVGFFAPAAAPAQSISTAEGGDLPSPPRSDSSAGSNSPAPVMIPPPRHLSAPVSVPASSSPLRREEQAVFPVGSYNPVESLLASSPSPSPSSRMDGADYSEDVSWGRAASSVSNLQPKSSLTTVSVVKMPPGLTEKGKGPVPEGSLERGAGVKPKEKLSKAERRALQEEQRAAKAAAKASGDGRKPEQNKVGKPTVQRKENIQAPSVQEKKVPERATEKDRKKDVPPPRLQFDDKNRVEKAKRRAIVNQSEARNIVELFRHLPQYVHGTQLPDLEAKFFQLDPMHPSVYKVGLQFLAGDITGGNGRCVAMLLAFRDAITDYSTPPEKTLVRDLTAKIGSYVSFLIECRPLSISMGNAIKFLKNRIAKLPLTLSESEAKSSLQADIDRFIHEKIILADKVIVNHAVTKIRDNDVLLVYGCSCVVEMILLKAHELGKNFRVVVVDSRPKLEGQALLRRLVKKGIRCTYTHINAISYVMHEATRVFLGASSVLSNGTAYSGVGAAAVAMVAHAFRVPVLVCCEAYKFHERVQLDSICFNELGDPEVISKVPGRPEVNHLDRWAEHENLHLLNLTYDTMPSDYISMIITDYGMVPATSVPVIIREYRREHVWI
ncbi:nagB/RpiA/CoA transferase-like superfamily protein [Wolffia australiana]